MRILTTILLTALLPLPAVAQGRFARATDIGRVDSIRSATLDEFRPYLVYTPPSYEDSTVTPQHYPVLYLLDGDGHFHSVSGLIQILGTGVNATYVVPEMIVVAIPNTARSRDLTPTRVERAPDGGPLPPGLANTGGNARLFTFLQTELIPHIESQYRTLPYRVFVGHSLGGITVLNALYTIPETFNGYIAIDPSLWWDDRVLLRRAREYFASARLEGKALWVAQANTNTPGDTARNNHFEAITQFNAIMKTFDRSGLRYGFRYYDDDSHGSVPLIATYDALRFFFEGYGIAFPLVVERPALLTEHFRGVSTRLGVTIRPSEGMLRQFGQAMMGQDTAKAIEFGRMRVDLYPESYRAHEFLGDAYAAQGEVQQARTHYEHALARSAGNARIREKLDKLGSS